MNRSSILVFAALTLVFSAGCNNAADEQAKANAAQAEANTKINQTKIDADVKMRAAQADADKKIAEAQANFMKLREDYRHTMTVRLVDLDKKVAVLDAKVKTLNGKAKTDLEMNLKTIHANRDDLTTNFNGLERATATTWDSANASLEKQWTDLKTLVDKT